MLTPEEQEQLKDELDSLLLFEIQARLVSGVFYGPDKETHVRLYLDQKALALARAAQAEQVEIARGANTRATIVIAGIAVLIALGTALIPLFATGVP